MKLNTCCNLVNFGLYSIVYSLGMGLFLFIDRPTLVCGWVTSNNVAAHPRTSEVEVTPGFQTAPGPLSSALSSTKV